MAAAWFVFFGAKRAAQGGLGAKRLEEIRAHAGAQNSFRALFSSEIEIRGGPGGEAFENGVLLSPVSKVWRRSLARPAFLPVDFPENGKLISSWERNRIYYPLAHHIEEQRAAADAQRQRENNQYGDARRFREHSDAVV